MCHHEYAADQNQIPLGLLELDDEILVHCSIIGLRRTRKLVIQAVSKDAKENSLCAILTWFKVRAIADDIFHLNLISCRHAKTEFKEDIND